MKFLCLGYLDVRAFESMAEQTRSELMESCMAQCIPFRATGKVREEEGLRIDEVKSLRPKGGKTVVTDGPFLPTEAQIGAFFVVEADSIEEAIEVASLHPGARCGEEYGFGIEIRPIA